MGLAVTGTMWLYDKVQESKLVDAVSLLYKREIIGYK